jgi:hypothetical protein
MREIPLLTPQWLQSDPRGRGSNSPLPDCNHGSPHSQLQGGRNPKTWGTNMSSRFVHDRACTPVPNSGWSPVGRKSTEHTLPCEQSVVTVPSCIRPSKRSLYEGNCTRTVKCSCVSKQETHWEKVVSLPPLPHWYPLSCWQVWFCTCRAQPGPNPTLGEVVCTKVLSTSWSTRFQTGASSCLTSVCKTPTHVLQKP